jgi:hypothetical protein
VADIIFAFDPAIDRPLAVPDDAPADIGAAIADAAAAALDAAVDTAFAGHAAALVLCGRVLDPRRASPAQAARLRHGVTRLAGAGCRTILVADDTSACTDLARLLGEPAGLQFVTPAAPLEFTIRGLVVEIVAGRAAAFHAPLNEATAPGSGPVPLRRRIVVGWDHALWQQHRWSTPVADTAPTLPDLLVGAASLPAAPADAGFAIASATVPAWKQPGAFLVWGSRGRPALPPGVHHLPALQARSAHEADAGSCSSLTLLERDDALAPRADAFAVPHADWRGSWQPVPTRRVTWRTISIESAAGGDEELATAVWSALESQPPASGGPLEIVRVLVECGTSVSRRVRIAEISAETLARVRQLYDAKSFRIWCRELLAHPGESLAPLGHARSGSRPGTTTSFSSALADIVTALEQADDPSIPPDMAREAGWLALELVESI